MSYYLFSKPNDSLKLINKEIKNLNKKNNTEELEHFYKLKILEGMTYELGGNIEKAKNLYSQILKESDFNNKVKEIKNKFLYFIYKNIFIMFINIFFIYIYFMFIKYIIYVNKNIFFILNKNRKTNFKLIII